jgi:hypothetical protein
LSAQATWARAAAKELNLRVLELHLGPSANLIQVEGLFAIALGAIVGEIERVLIGIVSGVLDASPVKLREGFGQRGVPFRAIVVVRVLGPWVTWRCSTHSPMA